MVKVPKAHQNGAGFTPCTPGNGGETRPTLRVPMRKTRIATLLALLTLSACAPVVLVGAGAVVADTVVEETQGGDGLF